MLMRDGETHHQVVTDKTRKQCRLDSELCERACAGKEMNAEIAIAAAAAAAAKAHPMKDLKSEEHCLIPISERV